MRLVDLGICPYRFGVVAKGKAVVLCKLFNTVRPCSECVDCPIRLQAVEAVRIFGEWLL